MHLSPCFPQHSSLRALLVLAAVWLAAPTVQGQVCDGTIHLATQAQVDAFDCTEVQYGLRIEGSDIVDLSPLANLTDVGSTLKVQNNPTLSSLNGLGAIGFVTRIDIENNDALTSLDGLGLTSVGYSFTLSDNDALVSLDGLDALSAVTFHLIITNNPALASLDGLGPVTTVGTLDIENNDALTSLDGLALTRVFNYLRIRDNDSLASLGALNTLTSIGNGLTIENNPALTSLDGLDALTTLGGNYSQIADHLAIRDNPALTSLDALAGITSSIRGFLTIINNDALPNVDGLAGIAYVEDDLYVSGNAVLAECTLGLGLLLESGSIGGYTSISNNAPGCNSVCEVVGECPVGTENEATPLATGLAAAYPNPASGATTITYTLSEPSDVRLSVYDALGRRVATLVEEARPAGAHEASFGQGFPAGVYVVRFEAVGEAWTERVTLVR